MEEKDSANLKLDAGAAAYRLNVRSSLTDLNGIPVFTDKFEQIRQCVDEGLKQAEDILKGRTFTEKMQENETDSILAQMFMVQDTQAIVRAERQEQAGYSATETIGSALLIGVVLLVGIGMLVKKKGTAKYDNDNQLPVEA